MASLEEWLIGLTSYEPSKSELEKYTGGKDIVIYGMYNILKKYGNNCLILSPSPISSVPTAGIYYSSDRTMEASLSIIEKKFKSCLKNSSDIIAIPYSVEGLGGVGEAGHQLMIIYRKSKNSFELFEPYGAESPAVGTIPKAIEDGWNSFKTIVNERWAGNIIPPEPTYIEKMDLCPTKGFQDVQTEAIDRLFGEKLVQGYCVLWSLFYLEMVLKNPDVEGRILIDRALNIYREMSDKEKVALIQNYFDKFKKAFLEEAKILISEEYEMNPEDIPEEYTGFLGQEDAQGSYASIKEPVEEMAKVEGEGKKKQKICGGCNGACGGKIIKGGEKEVLEDEIYTTEEVKYIPIRNKTAYIQARDELYKLLDNYTVPKIDSRKEVIGSIGRTTNFGYGLTRRGYKQFVNNKKHPELLKAIVKFGNQVVPKGFFYNAITLNHGVKAKKHIDGNNVGNSTIVGFGDYTGGNVVVYKPNGKSPRSLNIKDKPLLFNGALYPHRTEPFKGDRYTLIFFRQGKNERVEGVGPTVGQGKSDELIRTGVYA